MTTDPTITIRNQSEADALIPPALAKGPIHLRIDPMEGRIDVEPWLDCGYESGGPQGWIPEPSILSVTVSGGEKPIHPDWVRKLRDDCEAAGVGFVFESWGEYLPISQWDGDDFDGEIKTVRHDGAVFDPDEPHGFCCPRCRVEDVFRVGRERSGRMLDGRTHEGVINQ